MLDRSAMDIGMDSGMDRAGQSGAQRAMTTHPSMRRRAERINSGPDHVHAALTSRIRSVSASVNTHTLPSAASFTIPEFAITSPGR